VVSYSRSSDQIVIAGSGRRGSDYQSVAYVASTDSAGRIKTRTLKAGLTPRVSAEEREEILAIGSIAERTVIASTRRVYDLTTDNTVSWIERWRAPHAAADFAAEPWAVLLMPSGSRQRVTLLDLERWRYRRGPELGPNLKGSGGLAIAEDAKRIAVVGSPTMDVVVYDSHFAQVSLLPPGLIGIRFRPSP
jgi:hypothetical protein